MATPFDDFWAGSRLTPATQRSLAERLAEFRAEPDRLDPFALPGPYHELRRPNDRLSGLLDRRRSVREFADRPLSSKQLGLVLGALAEGAAGRSYPSAGGLYPLRCYPLLLDVRHELSGNVCRYEPQRHALQAVGPCPGWTELGPLLTAQPDASRPSLVLVFVLADDALFAKYDQRAGRFGLIEAGAAAQSVAIRLGEQGLGGYLLGAGADDWLLEVIGLNRTQARFALALACGVPKR